MQEEFYDADEILKDIDSVEEYYEDDEIREIDIENPRVAREGFQILAGETDEIEELFAA